MIKNLKVNTKLLFLLLTQSLATFTLVGCALEETTVPQEQYDEVKQDLSGDGLSSAGLVQTLDVPGESFKLITEYSCDSAKDRAWCITSDKFLYFKVYTEGLSADTNVYIDNIHIDTSILSHKEGMNGIKQDSMDDHTYNAQIIGFPIGNDICYYGVDAIEGCNQDFIQGTFYGMSGYASGEIEQRRYTEEDYLKYGVYASKFQIVYDLLIKGPNDVTPRNVSVNTDFKVHVTAAITPTPEVTQDPTKTLSN
jgi:hypothetical protein